MERRALSSLLCRLLLCAAVCTAYGASATSLLPPLLSHHVGSTASTASPALARPLVYKGKTIMKYVTKLRPTKVNGKVVGDAGASGRFMIKAVRFSATSYTIATRILALNLKSGSDPSFDYKDSCASGSSQMPGGFANITRPDSRHKPYSFRYVVNQFTITEAGFLALTESARGGKNVVVGRQGNTHALCGKVAKKVAYP